MDIELSIYKALLEHIVASYSRIPVKYTHELKRKVC